MAGARAVEAMQSAREARPRVEAEAAGGHGGDAFLANGRSRAVIEAVTPCVDGGRFEVKRTVGEQVDVEADVFGDGHDKVRAVVRHRRVGEAEWHEVEMQPIVNDRWRASFNVHEVGLYEFTVLAWVDHFGTWCAGLQKKADAGQDVSVDLLAGAQMMAERAQRAEEREGRWLREAAARLEDDRQTLAARVELALDERLVALAARLDPREFATELGLSHQVRVDRERARFSTWYELFPRSAADEPDRHGTFRDVEAKLGRIAGMGFDVLYLPPIHPIGQAFRKGPNNTIEGGEGSVGSPWAIGGKRADGSAGGHTDVHPQLGTLEDFERLVRGTSQAGMEIALDIAFQCSPDHPWVSEHPKWFKKRADGTIQYAENPPKKYQDIYPLDFESEDWQGLWRALRDVMLFWVDCGVKIFRVDNPHTKAFGFWEWAIGEIKRRHEDVLFLSEAFTRPKLMYRLAKLGFTQSYTYFAWRNEPWEIEQYFMELTSAPVADFFRPNAWPNTPDILSEYLQRGGRAALMVRLVLAATLCASYGIYGPPYEAEDVQPLEPGKEEYLNSEKYQIRFWDWGRPRFMRDFISRVNEIRRAHPALQQDRTLKFHRVTEPLVCYSKRAGDDVILCVVNTDPHDAHEGGTSLEMKSLGLDDNEVFEVHDLLTSARYTWHGAQNYVRLEPWSVPAHVFHVRRLRRTETDREEFV